MRKQSLFHLLNFQNETEEFSNDNDRIESGKNQRLIVPMIVLAIASYSIFSSSPSSEESFISEKFVSYWIYRIIFFFLMNVISIGLFLVSSKIVNSNEYCRYALYTFLIMMIAQFPMEKYFSLKLHDEKVWKHSVEYSNKIMNPTVYTNVTFSKIQYEYKLSEIAKWYRIPILNDSYLSDEDSLFYNSPNDMNYCNYKASVESEWLEYLKAAKEMTSIPLNRMKILEKFNSTMSFKLYKSISKIVNSIKSVHDLKLTKTRLEQGISNECKGEYFKLIWWDFNKESVMNCTYIIKFSNNTLDKRRGFETILDFERQQEHLEPNERKYLEDLYKPESKWAISRRTIFDTDIFVSVQSKSITEDFEDLLTHYSNTTNYVSSPNQCKEEQHTTYLGDYRIENVTRFEWIHSYYPVPYYSGAIIASMSYLIVITCKVLLVILFGFIINHIISYAIIGIVDEQQQQQEEHEQVVEEINSDNIDMIIPGTGLVITKDNIDTTLFERQMGNSMRHGVNDDEFIITNQEEIIIGEDFEELRNSRKSRPNQSSDSISSQDDSGIIEEQISTLLSSPSSRVKEVVTELPPLQNDQSQHLEQLNLLFTTVTRRKNPSTKRSFAFTTENVASDDFMDDDVTKHTLEPFPKKIKKEDIE